MANPDFLLTVTAGPDQGKRLTLTRGRAYKIGCDVSDDLVLTDPMVLKGHCSVEISEQGVILTNHTASAGTFLGEKRVAKARLPAKATFRIGESKLTIRPVAAVKAQPSATGGAGGGAGSRRGGEDDPLIGKIVGGYKLLKVIGRGGMGVVYKAVQLSLQREIALKVLARHLAKDQSFRDMFINEARAAAQLVHPNIVQVYDAGSEGDVTYFSMEYIGQGSVEEILEREKKIVWSEAILLVLEAAHGLQFAEGKQIVHRDIKPDNLMLNDDGRVKIADLGLAKQGESDHDQGIIGTPHFIPPEQALGKAVDTRADIYSLGATFFRMVTGKTVFSGKTGKEIVLKHIKEPPPATSSLQSDVPDDLDAVIAKMLAKDPDQRYESATALIAALESVCAEHGIKGSIIRKGVSKKILVPLLLLLIGAGFAIFHFASKDQIVRPDPETVQQLADARKAQAAARERAKKRETDIRRGDVDRDWLKLDGNFERAGGMRGVLSHRDVQDGEGDLREEKWLGWAKKFSDFSAQEEVVEFESELGLSEKAKAKATEITDTVQEVKETTADKQAKIAAALASIQQLDTKQRAEVDGFVREKKYSKAYVRAEQLSREKPLKNDPFAAILAGEWVSPISQSVRQPFRDMESLVAPVEKARTYFGQRKDDILRSAVSDWNEVKAKTPAKDTLAKASDKDLADALALLEPIWKNFGSTPPAIRDASIAADQRYKSIVREQKARTQQILLDDREAVKDTLRNHRSLSPDVLPNTVMSADFDKAREAWQQLLDTGRVRGARYTAFVKERIEALRYIEFLFGQFRKDVRITDVAPGANAPMRSLKSVFITASGKKFTFNFDKADSADAGPGRFWMNKKYKGSDERIFGQFGMDWVYTHAFCEPGSTPGELRWRTPSSAVRFSVAIFCFETMQYAASAEHFDLLADDPTYGAVAKSFAARAKIEAQALEGYALILKAYRDAKTVEEIELVAGQLRTFAKSCEGTLFHVDLLASGDKLSVDIYPKPTSDEGSGADSAIPALQPAPPAPK